MLVIIYYHSARMELRHLRYFVAVAEELSFRKASQRLNISRPALSKQIKDLETEIAVRLLERDTVNVSLTKAGEIFLKDSQAILAHTQQAMDRAAEAQAGHRGNLRIGSAGMIAMEFLPRALKKFNQKYPNVEVMFMEMTPVEQLDALGNGKIDIGFAYGKEVKDIAHLRRLSVIQSIYGVAISKQHPLAKRKQITLQELGSETLLHIGSSSHGETILKICSDEGMDPLKIRQVLGFDSMVTLIAADQGVSLLPTLLDLTNQNIVIIPIKATVADIEFHMWVVWQGQTPAYHIKHFIQLLEERMQSDEFLIDKSSSGIAVATA